jgi:hypothetical protein
MFCQKHSDYTACIIIIIIIIIAFFIISSVLLFVNTREHHSAYLNLIVIVTWNMQDFLIILSVYIPYFATNLIDIYDIKEIPSNSL